MFLFIKEWGAILVAIASLIVAILSFIKSSKSQRLQNQINEIELRIKNYELEKINTEKAAADKSCVEARVISVTRNSYKLKVWNSGNVTAYNITATFEDGSEILIIDEKMPFEELEPGKSFDVNLMVHFGSKRKFRITTAWEDASGAKYEKTQYGDR